MNYPEVIDYAPLHINAQELHAIIARHGGNEVDETVALTIAGYANPRGEAFPRPNASRQDYRVHDSRSVPRGPSPRSLGRFDDSQGESYGREIRTQRLQVC